MNVWKTVTLKLIHSELTLLFLSQYFVNDAIKTTENCEQCRLMIWNFVFVLFYSLIVLVTKNETILHWNITRWWKNDRIIIVSVSDRSDRDSGTSRCRTFSLHLSAGCHYLSLAHPSLIPLCCYGKRPAAVCWHGDISQWVRWWGGALRDLHMQITCSKLTRCKS